MHVTTPIPDARRSDPSTYCEEVGSLLRIIRQQCTGPDGRAPTMQQVGDLLGYSDSMLYGYITQPKGRRRPIVPPFPLVFALRVMLGNLPAVQRAIWGQPPAAREDAHGAP